MEFIIIVALGVGGGFVLLCGVAVITGMLLSAPGHAGSPTPRFNGRTFVNREPTALPDFKAGTRFMFHYRPPRAWDRWRDLGVTIRPPARVAGAEMRATYINHATVLVQMQGLNFLTDPMWSSHAGPWGRLGPRRRHAPGLSMDELPPIDAVLVSHNHYDHMDVATLRGLRDRFDPMFITGLGNAAYLRRRGIRKLRELDWGGEMQIGDARVVGQPARHFSSRGLLDRNRTLWMSFVVEGALAGRFYFAGDTSYGVHFRETADTFGPIRLAILPIGAYEPRWFMESVHMNPSDAVKAHADLRATQSLAIHFGTFRLTQEAQDEPVRDLRKELSVRGLDSDQFLVLAPGEGRDLPRA